MIKNLTAFSTALGLAILATSPSYAATKVELNSLSQEDEVCRLTFTINSDEGLSALQTQTVLFDKTGAVHLFTLFDFGEIPKNGMRVRQFDIPTLPCSETTLVLFNGLDICESNGVACPQAPEFSSRVEGVEVQQ